jgi:hypothetical protein
MKVWYKRGNMCHTATCVWFHGCMKGWRPFYGYYWVPIERVPEWAKGCYWCGGGLWEQSKGVEHDHQEAA